MAIAKTPIAESAPANIDAGANGDALQEALLPAIERQLAAFIGPLAKILVRRAASKTTSIAELYSTLAASLEREDDRKAFLAKRAELFGAKAGVQFTKLVTPTVAPAAATPLEPTSAEITAAAVELAARRLAAYLGPIAPILARKEARHAKSLRDFYELLAEHVGDSADRERFLKDSGVPRELPSPGLLARRNETSSFNAPAGHVNPERKGD